MFVDVFRDAKFDGRLTLNGNPNPNAPKGLTVNLQGQGTMPFCLKSDAVATGLTTALGGSTPVQGNDFLAVYPLDAAAGGLVWFSMAEAALARALDLLGVGGQPETTASTTALAGSQVRYIVHDGANALANIGAGGLVFGVRTFIGSASRSLFFVDAEGDLFVDGSIVPVAFDDLDDVALVRAFDLLRAPGQVIREEWDAFVQYGREDLVKAGILSDPHDGGDPMVNITQLQRLHNGALWQLHTRIAKEERQLAQQELKLNERVAAVEQRLLALVGAAPP